ncbi:MAG: EutN/CcmL family microcompartment protein [Anaerobacillus sp.]|uniref:EutN/CcmL family microcompartment protein n=1 Tax=Anaerobacillus sp. TaxID=1872506 RepID=UPI00391C53C0
MNMAKVIGNVVATKKEESLTGYKLMIIQIVDSNSQPTAMEEVVVDCVGAGIGDHVLITKGSSARKILRDQNSPVDAVIVGIIDRLDK